MGVLAGQTIRVTGKVLDKTTQEGIPFCNVYNPDDPTQGISTDLDGYYELLLPAETQGIAVSAIGYELQYKAIAASPAEQEINFFLTSSTVDIQEVVLIAGEDPPCLSSAR
ncbi:MAG: carboxypeptidase-like regulatory domain-containing protein [Saprospiraceae bacterium]